MTTPEQPPPPSAFVARGPTDLVAMVPVVLGFHPEDSVVVLTFRAAGRSMHARVDLPVAVDAQAEVTDLLAAAVRRNGAERAALVFYTDDVAAAESQAAMLLGRLSSDGIAVVDLLRVDDGHWYPVPDDGSAGTPFDLETHPFTAQRVFEGRLVHRDREELADTLVGTDDADATEVALAATRYADLALAEAARGSEPERRRWMAHEGRWLQQRVRQHVRDGRWLSAADAGRALVLLGLIQLRDVAWSELTRVVAARHVDLWRDLVRRAPVELSTGPAALLAFSAWQHGDGALAWCAVDRCLQTDPDYSLAHLVSQVLTGAVPPDVWQPVPVEELPVFRDDPGHPVGRAS